VKQAMFAYVNQARIRSNEGKVSCSRKQRGTLLELQLMTDRHPPTTSQPRYPRLHKFNISNKHKVSVGSASDT